MPRLTRALAGATVLLLVAGVLVTRWAHLEPDPGYTGSWCGQLLTALTYGFVGVALGERVAPPASRIAVILQLTGLTQAAGLLAGAWSRNPALPGHPLAAWLDGWVWVPGVLPVLIVLPLVFPAGRPLAGGWRWLAWFAVVLCAGFTVGQAVAARPGAAAVPLMGLLTALVAATAALGVASLIVRYVRQDSTGRSQTKWLVAAVLVLVAFEAIQGALPRPVAVTGLTLLPLLLPVAVGLAVSRFRLYDVDLVVSRIAAYAVLTAVLTAGYLGATLALGLKSDPGRGSGALGVLLVLALVATPVRGLLQRRLDRWLLGDRSPSVAVGRLARRLRDTIAPDTVPNSVVRTVRESLRVPHARLAVAADDEIPLLVVEEGTPAPGTQIPVRYAGRRVGTLTVGWRTPQEPFGDAERRLLHVLSEAAAPALDGLLLAAELRQARQRAATAQDEERDRLHRDLHDGLGPTLAGITLGLDAVRNLVAEDPARAGEAVDRLRELASGATDDIRSLVRGLGPGSLESVGLAETIRRHAEVAAAGIQVNVDIEGDLAGLPEAVEVAAVHIALEALTNVRRHAGASTCWIRLAHRGGQLEVRVDDDGHGPSAGSLPGGLGRASMRTRAEQVGGTSSWGTSPRGGVSVRATLPVPQGVAG